MAVVVDALVSKVVDVLISTSASEIEQQIRLVVGVEQEVQSLTSSLRSIQAVLVEAERRQLKDETIQTWLGKLKGIAYDIDDVVDEWSYQILKSQFQRGENSLNPTRKVRSFSSLSCCFCFRKVAARHRIAVQISNLNQRLNVIASEKDKYSFRPLTVNEERVERDITTSVIDLSEVKGRDVDKEKLVNLLLSECGQTSKPRLIPIVGMGGIGKTTLARVVYNDEGVMSRFDKRIWVCVSDPFDEIRIAKEILESLQGTTPNLNSFSNIMESIQESIKGKTILVVLDDVWNEDPKKWKQLEDCLKGGSPRSCILVTTRNENVGKIMGCFELDIFRVGLLSREESWELFCMIAFSRRSSEERVGLEEIGRKVVERCKRLPLAVKSIASLLQFKDRRMEWQSVLDSQLWGMEEVQRDIVGPLWLSYYDLPSELKQCFSYCAIFPKDYKMAKDDLIKLWIAQGYIKGTQSKSMEMVGGEYFQYLAMRSLFQDIELEKYSGVTWCKMHDMVHDLAQLLGKKECYTIHLNKSLHDSDGNSLRHLSISLKAGVHCPVSLYNLKKLRSLIFLSIQSFNELTLLSSHWSPLDLETIFNELTLLRVLRLCSCGIKEVPSNINRLIHLRELDLSDNYELQGLPDTVWELYNLQILNWGGNGGTQSFRGIRRLTNLRHLGNSATSSLLPKEMVKLSCLRRLNELNINVNNEEAFSLKHLKNFNQLGGSLAIYWLKRGDGDVEDAKQAHMKDKKYITELLIYLNEEEKDLEWREKQDEELVEALNVPPNLEFLRVFDYQGLRPPNMLDSLTVVEWVYLHDWSCCEHLPNNLGKLPCLKELQLSCFYSVRKVDAEFLGSSSTTSVPLFPKLTSLHFWSFVEWEEWNDGDEEMLIMPSLTILHLRHCPKLKSLPKFILKKTALKLFITECDALEQSPSRFMNFGSETKDKE